MRSTGTIGTCGALLLGAVWAQGCGPALIGAGLAGASVLDRDDPRPLDTPPSASVTTPAGVVNDVITLRYRLTDPDVAARTSVAVAFSVDGGATFKACTAAFVEGAAGTEGLAAAPGGTDHLFQWSSASDLGFVDVPAVVLRVTPGDGGAEARTAAFAVFNRYMTSVARARVPPGVQGTGVAVLSDGDALLADAAGHRVVRVDRATGAAAVVAGTGVGGSQGDGRPGPEAQLNGPLAAVPGVGAEVIIADTQNGLLRRVDGATGFISTLAGQGDDAGEDVRAVDAVVDAPRDVAVDRRGAIWFIEASRLRVINAGGSQTIQAFRCDPGGGSQPATALVAGRVRTVVPSGTGSDLERPVALALFDDGSRRVVYVLELGPEAPTSGFPRVVVVNDGASSLDLGLGATTITVPARGAVGVTTATFAGAGAAPPGLLADLAILDAQAWLFTSGRNNQVRAVNASPVTLTLAGTTVPARAAAVVVGKGGAPGIAGDGGPALQAELAGPVGVAFDAAGGHTFMADANARLRVAASGAQDLVFGGRTIARGAVGTVDVLLPGTAPAVSLPRALALGPGGDLLVADGRLDDPRSNRILRLSAADLGVSPVTGTGTVGAPATDGPAAAARVALAIGVAHDATRDLVLHTDAFNHVLRAVNVGATERTLLGVKVAPGGAATVIGTGVKAPVGVGAANGDGGPARQALLAFPSLVALDAARGLLWVSDTDAHRLRAVNPGDAPVTVLSGTIAPGAIATVVGTGAQGTPADDGDGGPAGAARLTGAAAVLGPDGNLYVLDGLLESARAPRLRVVNLGATGIVRGGVSIAPGAIDTVAATGALRSPGAPTGDGGPALQATLRDPAGLAVRSDLVALVADAQDHLVRAVNLGPAAATVAGRTIPPGGIDAVVGSGVPGFDGDPSPARGAVSLVGPAALLLLDDDRLLVCDGNNGALRLVALGQARATFGGIVAAPGQMAIVAGSRAGRGAVANPIGIGLDLAGTIVVSDLGDNFDSPALLKVDPRTRAVVPVAGTGARTRQDGSDRGDGGPALLATFEVPLGIDVDDDGSLWICDGSAQRVRFVNRGPAAVSPIPGVTVQPQAIATVVQGASGDKDLTNDDGVAVVSSPTTFDLGFPLSVDRAGTSLWVVDLNGGRPRTLRIDLTTGRVAGVLGDLPVPIHPASTGTASAGAGLADSLDDAAAQFVTRMVKKGDIVRVTGGPVTKAGAAPPFDATVTADATAQTTLELDADIEPDATGFTYEVVRRDVWTAVAATTADEAYVAGLDRGEGGGRVYRVRRNGATFDVTRVAGAEKSAVNGDLRTALEMQFGTIADLDVDGDLLLVADGDSNRLVAVNLGGGTLTVAGLDVRAGEARVISGAGLGSPGFNGDALPAPFALINSPSGVAVRGGGVFFTDTGNNRVRRFQR